MMPANYPQIVGGGRVYMERELKRGEGGSERGGVRREGGRARAQERAKWQNVNK